MAHAAGATVALLGALALAVTYHRGAGDRSAFEDGLLTAALAYDRAVPLLGLGLAMARQTALGRWSSFLSLAVGVAAGIGSEGTIANSAFVADHLFVLSLAGPITCVLAGVGLALPLFLQAWMLPLLAAVFGFLLGLAIGLASPAGNALAFSTGGAVGGLWIAVTPALLCPPLEWRPASVLVRILGSWLIAIGVLLGGTRLIPPKTNLEPLPPSQPLTLFPRGGEDEFRQP